MTERPHLTVLPGGSQPSRVERIAAAIEPLSHLAGRIYIDCQGLWQGLGGARPLHVPHDWLVDISPDREPAAVMRACFELAQAGLIVVADLPTDGELQRHGPNVAYAPHPARPELLPARLRGRV